AADLSVVRTFESGQDYIRAIDLSPDGEVAATAGHEPGEPHRHTVRLWDVKTGKSRRGLEGHTNTILDVRFTRDGNAVLACVNKDEVRVWNVADGKELKPIRLPGVFLHGLGLPGDGKRVLIVGNTELVLWDLEKDGAVATMSTPGGYYWGSAACWDRFALNIW